MDAAIVIGLVLLSIVMFAFERIPIEVASLVIILLLAVTGVLSAGEAFAGLSNGTVIFIFTLLAMTQGLASTGVMQLAVRRAAFIGRFGQRTFLAVLLSIVAAFSSIASNTAVTAAFIPIATATAARARVPLSRVLLPLAYSSMIGGTIFLFGTSTNLVVSEAMVSSGMAPLGFAELAILGVPLTVLTIAWVVAMNRFVPVRGPERVDPPLAHREFVTEALLTERSRLIGAPLSAIAETLGIETLGVVRNETWIPAQPEARVAADDRLLIRGNRRAILRIKDLRSMVLASEVRLEGEDARPVRKVLVEAFVPHHSPLVGSTMGESRFAERYGLLPLAIHRHPAIEGGLHSHLHLLRPVFDGRSLRATRLSAGDVLLLSGPVDRVRELSRGDVLTPVGDVPYERPRYTKAGLAVALFAAAVFAAGTRLVDPPVAGLAGMLAMIGTGCIDAGRAFRVEWRVVLLIGSLLAMGRAMEKSGAGELIASGLVPVAEVAGARAVLFLVMLITVALSAPMSNQAAALVVLPVAVHVASALGLDARAFAIATCLAASCSFVTPLEPSAALVYGPGHYRFADFVRVGGPLTLVILVLLTFAIPVVWPLR